MQFGIHLPTYWTDYGVNTVRSVIEKIAKAAEALGYAAVWANASVVTSSANKWTGPGDRTLDHPSLAYSWGTNAQVGCFCARIAETQHLSGGKADRRAQHQNIQPEERCSFFMFGLSGSLTTSRAVCWHSTTALPLATE